MPNIDQSPLWPARLHHLQLESDQPERMVEFYRDRMFNDVTQLDDGRWLAHGPDRLILITGGRKNNHSFGAYNLGDPQRLAALRARVEGHGIAVTAEKSPFLAPGAWSVTDPCNFRMVFGVAAPNAFTASSGDKLSGRLQHYVVGTDDFPSMEKFYLEGIGFRKSDMVRNNDALHEGPNDSSDPDKVENGEPMALFMRSDPEHHSFAVFKAKAGNVLDHHSYEADNWDAVRDWCDHFGKENVKLELGPGRRGPGDNLFAMVHDPDGNWIEISAETEHMTHDDPHRVWPHEQKTLNLWGEAILRA